MTTGCAATTTERLRLPPLETVAHVDLSRYLGTWYEIASFPQSFQRGCTATTATYTATRASSEPKETVLASRSIASTICAALGCLVMP